MPKRVTGTTWTARRPVRIGATAYAAGAAIPGAVLKNVRGISALVSRGFIRPSQDLYGRTRMSTRAFPDRTFTPSDRRSL